MAAAQGPSEALIGRAEHQDEVAERWKYAKCFFSWTVAPKFPIFLKIPVEIGKSVRQNDGAVWENFPGRFGRLRPGVGHALRGSCVELIWADPAKIHLLPCGVMLCEVRDDSGFVARCGHYSLG